jgi:hypothetical protein
MSSLGEFELIEETTEIPKGSGIDGFLLVIKHILIMPRVQSITIDGRGKIHMKRYARKDEPTVQSMLDLATVEPATIAMANTIEEVVYDQHDLRGAIDIVCMLMSKASVDKLYPVCFLAGVQTPLFDWIRKTSMFTFSPDSLMGFPVHLLRTIPDDTLLLCTAFGPRASVVDIRHTYKVALPLYNVKPANPYLVSVTIPKGAKDAVE